MPLISFSCLIALLEENGKSGHPCLVPDFRGLAFSFSSLKMILVVDLSYMAFLCYVLSMLTLLNFFIINGH